jgi:D-amino peptidase
LLGPGLQTVAVKRGLGRFSARHLAPARARERIEAGAKHALARLGDAPVYDPGGPCTITVELATPDDADVYRHRDGVTLTGPRTVESQAPRWWDAWRRIYL